MPAGSAPIRAVFVTAIVLSVTGCSLKSGDQSSAGTGGAGVSGGVGVSGGGGVGFGGSAGFFMDAGGAAVGGDQGLCGVCPEPPPSMLSAFVSTCCDLDLTCGLSAPGILADPCIKPQSGVTDPICPGAGEANGIPILGCCTVTGVCGLALDPLGLGCVTRADLAPIGIFSFGNFPGEIPCGPPDADAGAADAGDPICAWATSVGVCDPIATCERVGSSPLCTCPNGYADLSPNGQRGALCRDVNECLLGSGVCDAGQCVNTPGGFACESIDQ